MVVMPRLQVIFIPIDMGKLPLKFGLASKAVKNKNTCFFLLTTELGPVYEYGSSSVGNKVINLPFSLHFNREFE